MAEARRSRGRSRTDFDKPVFQKPFGDRTLGDVKTIGMKVDDHARVIANALHGFVVLRRMAISAAKRLAGQRSCIRAWLAHALSHESKRRPLGRSERSH